MWSIGFSMMSSTDMGEDPIGVPWNAPGRKLVAKSLSPPCHWVGLMVMKPGRSWFSVPRPYTVQAPMLGREKENVPVNSCSMAAP